MRFLKTHNWAYGNVMIAFALLFGMASLATLSARAVDGDVTGKQQEPPPIQIIPGDGMNLQIEEQISSHYVVVKVNPPVHNWFAGTFTNLPTDKEVTIGLSMDGMDTKGNKGNVSKWHGLIPVITYADPEKYEAYEWFQKDEQGRWVSGDPLKQGSEARFAGIGKVPKQTVIPKEVAAQFLSEDGNYWQAWREVDNAEAVATLNIFRIKQKFDYPSAVVAMRVPYTYAYQKKYNEIIAQYYSKRVSIHSIGNTPQGRNLIIYEVNPRRLDKSNPAVLILAREHATEHDSSWVTKGAIDFILKHPELSNITWLIVPIYDPDGAANSTFDRLIDRWTDNPTPPIEVSTYARWLVNRYNSGGTIDLAISIHNIECNEGRNIESPTIRSNQSNFGLFFNKKFFDRLSLQGYQVGSEEPWDYTLSNFRMHGWCALRLNALNLAFEINSRYPPQRLSSKGVESIGYTLIDEIANYFSTAEGERYHNQLVASLRVHVDAYKSWLQTTAYSHGQSELFNLFINAYSLP